MIFCKKDCKFLYPTEKQKDLNKTFKGCHWCDKYNKRIIHGIIYHPNLIAIKGCSIAIFKKEGE